MEKDAIVKWGLIAAAGLALYEFFVNKNEVTAASTAGATTGGATGQTGQTQTPLVTQQAVPPVNPAAIYPAANYTPAQVNAMYAGRVNPNAPHYTPYVNPASAPGIINTVQRDIQSAQSAIASETAALNIVGGGVMHSIHEWNYYQNQLYPGTATTDLSETGLDPMTPITAERYMSARIKAAQIAAGLAGMNAPKQTFRWRN